MIEQLLRAENALVLGLLDQAEQIYAQTLAHDPANAIALVGLSRVALERGDERGSLTYARRAMAIDPENGQASRMVVRLEEVIRERGDAIPQEEQATTAPPPHAAPAAVAPPTVAHQGAIAPTVEPPPDAPSAAVAPPTVAPPNSDSGADAAPKRRSFLRRLTGRS